ncbi:biopolymer transport protein ExbB/TolQ [Catalinimonas alkaloidigena]|uniref:hypothetical protein n=1 Tax=Catalinimonas alkaloidigena TaxID=1075417 RepID=UPI0024066CAA|nr:hypothetical protein [Catalinimonas alkaloidigena]MDF9799743.1 biopolymer transport protein ExbB/TolQ [Catalinimonas alkaloidigena]
MTKLYEKAADSLFSLPPILIGFFAIFGYLIFESQALISGLLPAEMGDLSREVAAGFLAVAIHLMILLTATNSKLVSHAFTIFYAFCSYGITALFFDAFEFSGKSNRAIFSAHLFSVLIASINYLVVYLLVGKYYEVKDNRSAVEKLQDANELLSQREETIRLLNETLTYKERQLTNSQQEATKSNESVTKLNEALQRVNQEFTESKEAATTYYQKLSEAQEQKQSLEKELHQTQRSLKDKQDKIFRAYEKLYCPHCESSFTNVNAHNVHKRNCK